ncbi:NifB/NifX family molybdenum-iron cluster-binding protein [Desulfotomaculum copahuensis]|uniref:Diguanylate cyclase n=1 Tax=Desulfotomaculum copahuensis TaxID=1838280 RepID=A0A1B7LI21_9FIRM|nr:NifB/NifX family molybdenum-iron cluster-binding protein [Desulfotomaculum copahuensis]OAT85937.1 diguanylate cyclase [Desulfotomaculum copahuensis]
MKIAVPNERGRVNQHFGRSQEFLIMDLEGDSIKEQHTVSAAQLQHNHEGLAGLLKREGVDTVILGGIGPAALQALEAAGFNVITGASGEVAAVARDCARGELVSRGAVCDHSHGHDHNCHGQA